MVLVGTKLKNANIDAHYDAIVIGSGIGGLSAAAVLSLAGKKALVVERHYTAGGFTHSYLRRGYEWDVGVHYIGEVHKPLSPMRRAFDLVSEGRLQWAEMGEVYDSILVGQERYDFRTGRERFRSDLHERFPGEERAIDGYLRKVAIANNVSLPGYVAGKLAPSFLGGAARLLGGLPGFDYFRRTTGEVLDSLGASPKLKGVLTGQWGDYGVPPSRSSFAMQALVANHYFDGGNFPVGGSSNIARSIVPTIEKAGGAVVTEAEVEEILIENNRAKGVRLPTGDVHADVVISAAGFVTTSRRLLPEDVRERYGFTQKVELTRSSIGHLGLYIGLDGSPSELGLPKNNLWVYADYDHDAAMLRLQGPDSEFPVVYISFPSAKDPSWEARYPGRATIEVVCPAPYAWFKQWEAAPWSKRGAEYEDFKAGLSERLLEYVYHHVPQVRGRIAYHELSTPLSTRHFSNYDRGELYGLEHTPDRFALPFLRPRTPIDNLYMTGQDILSCGVGSALFTGIMTASLVLGPRTLSVLPGLLAGIGGSGESSATGPAPAKPTRRRTPRRAVAGV